MTARSHYQGRPIHFYEGKWYDDDTGIWIGSPESPTLFSKKIESIVSLLDLRDLSQFTIDWIENANENTNDEALHYEIENIRAVLKEGPDKKLFDLLALFYSLLLPEKGTL